MGEFVNFWSRNAILSPTVLYAAGKIVRDGSSKIGSDVGRWGQKNSGNGKRG